MQEKIMFFEIFSSQNSITKSFNLYKNVYLIMKNVIYFLHTKNTFNLVIEILVIDTLIFEKDNFAILDKIFLY